MLIDMQSSLQSSQQLGEKIKFDWAVDMDRGTVRIHVKARLGKHDWVGVGFSDYGALTGADMCLLWRDWKRKTKLSKLL